LHKKSATSARAAAHSAAHFGKEPVMTARNLLSAHLERQEQAKQLGLLSQTAASWVCGLLLAGVVFFSGSLYVLNPAHSDRRRALGEPD
ncbi:MAG TPA: hypothetical protein VF311_13215, partial [Terriglobales bacterium]